MIVSAPEATYPFAQRITLLNPSHETNDTLLCIWFLAAV
jgi:hypothetical protein